MLANDGSDDIGDDRKEGLAADELKIR